VRPQTPTRLRLLAVIGSLLLHGAIISIAWYAPVRSARRPAPAPLVIDLTTGGAPRGELRASPQAAPRPRHGTTLAPGRPLVRLHTPPSSPAPVPTAPAPAKGAELGTATGEGHGIAAGPPAGTPGVPRRLDLLPRPVPPTPEREHADELRTMVDEPWRERGRELQLEKDLTVGRATLAPMEQRMGQWFAPDPAPLLARAGGRLPPPRRPIDATDPSSLAVPRFSSDLEQVVSMLRFGGVAPELHAPPTAAKGLPAPPLYTVGGATAKLLAELATLIQIDHDVDGTPAAWRLVESSGDAGFDREALAAVQDGLANVGKLALRGERKPAWSRWRFGAQLYWWRKDADPSFRPPGVPVEGGGLIGTRTVIRETTLVALGFRPAPPASPAEAAPAGGQ
jgi:hypothetical protein